MQLKFRQFIFIVLLMALPIAYYMLVAKPMQLHRANLDRDTAAKEQKLTQLNSVVSGNSDLPQQIDKYKKAIEQFQARLPEKHDMDRVLEEIWKIAKDNHLTTKSVRSMPPIPAANYSEQPMRVMFTGPVDSFYRFLDTVEGLPRIMHINDMTIVAFDAEPGNIKAEFTLSIYFAREKDAVAEAP